MAVTMHVSFDKREMDRIVRREARRIRRSIHLEYALVVGLSALAGGCLVLIGVAIVVYASSAR